MKPKALTLGQVCTPLGEHDARRNALTTVAGARVWSTTAFSWSNDEDHEVTADRSSRVQALVGFTLPPSCALLQT